ncbi:MarR family winged helix-turn-helix transcriptional regulator [Clostridium cellulovorans]|uniref:Transcriptional regulator, MarR family n=1 Tax=Clostridium cellulovorans (strain ATCC 35296 / DSM 3052 / OCM 3 / 743B) TaxID=573061 RepID=D9SWR9_CLOC7|nr:MarR family transcriptional regulator [Clostridium cellulovorans]ADL51280.1 transcriptional regulator, MarR family [Clostridium cellulovorans 743B]
MSYESLKLDNQICFALYASSKEIIKKYKPLLDPLGITYTQYIVLLALWEEDNITVKHLGERLLLDSGTLTPLLKRLEAQNLLKRARSEADERNVYVSLTKEGLELRDAAVDIPEKLFCSSSLSGEEAIMLHKLLYKVIYDCNIK